MNLELFGKSKFQSEMSESDSVWVAMKANEAFVTLDQDGRNCVSVWSNRKKALVFLKAMSSQDLAPVEVPRKLFISQWLSNPDLDISAVYVNPKFNTGSALCYENAEFQSEFSET